MKKFTITVSFENPWFLAQVEGVDEFYAQGKSYEEALENLFSVIQNIREIRRRRKKELPVEMKKISFSVPYPNA